MLTIMLDFDGHWYTR